MPQEDSKKRHDSNIPHKNLKGHIAEVLIHYFKLPEIFLDQFHSRISQTLTESGSCRAHWVQ